MRRLKQTGKSNEAKQERLSILCFWQMLTWFSEKMPQGSKTVLLKERWHKYLTSWHTLYKKNTKRWVRLAFIYCSLHECPRKKTYRNKFMRSTQQAQPLLLLLIYVWLSVQLFRWDLFELIHVYRVCRVYRDPVVGIIGCCWWILE